MTESRAVSTITGSRLPCERSASRTSKPSMPGRPMSRTSRSNWPDSASSRPVSPSPTTAVWWPSARRPLATKEAMRSSSSTIRMRAMARGLLVDGQDDLEAGAVRLGVVDVDVAAVRLDDGAHDRQAEAEALVAGPDGAPAEALEDRGRGPRGGRRRRRPRTQSRTVSARRCEPMPIRTPGSVCLTALSASWSSAWVIRCSSMCTQPVPVPSSSHCAVAERAGLVQQRRR